MITICDLLWMVIKVWSRCSMSMETDSCPPLRRTGVMFVRRPGSYAPEPGRARSSSNNEDGWWAGSKKLLSQGADLKVKHGTGVHGRKLVVAPTVCFLFSRLKVQPSLNS
jgi:hypothetical protein